MQDGSKVFWVITSDTGWISSDGITKGLIHKWNSTATSGSGCGQVGGVYSNDYSSNKVATKYYGCSDCGRYVWNKKSDNTSFCAIRCVHRTSRQKVCTNPTSGNIEYGNY